MPNRFIALWFSLLSSCAAFSDESFFVSPEQLLDLKNDDGKCYWMENYSGDYQWIPARLTWGSNLKITKQACYALDSCDGGLGRSGGGCYKWATGSGNKRTPWNINDLQIRSDRTKILPSMQAKP